MCISLHSCSLYSCPTVLNIPFLVFAPPNIDDVSLATVAPRPTMSAKGRLAVGRLVDGSLVVSSLTVGSLMVDILLINGRKFGGW